MELTSLLLQSSQETGEPGDRRQGSMSRRDQRNKINVTRNQRETEEPGGGIPEGTVLHIQAQCRSRRLRIGGWEEHQEPPGGAAQSKAAERKDAHQVQERLSGRGLPLTQGQRRGVGSVYAAASCTPSVQTTEQCRPNSPRTHPDGSIVTKSYLDNIFFIHFYPYNSSITVQ